MVVKATSLRSSKSAMSSSDSLTPKTLPKIKRRVASYHTSKAIAHKAMQLQQIASQNWLPWQRPSAHVDPHLTHDSFGRSEPMTQTASRLVQPFLQGSLVCQTDIPTDHATGWVTIGRIVRSTAMWPNNNTTVTFMVLSSWTAIARVHPVHSMKAD